MKTRAGLILAVAAIAAVLMSPGLASAAGFVNYHGASIAQYGSTTSGTGTTNPSSGAVQGTQAGGGSVQGTQAGAVSTGSSQLPFTGFNVATLLVIALGLFAAGTGLRAGQRLLARH